MLGGNILLRVRGYSRLLYNSIISTKTIKDIIRKFTTLVYTKTIDFNITIFILIKIVLKGRKYLVFSS